MAASTIPNSGGPGSPVELSPVTIAVRDKVIEKFTGQPLDEMNNSLKALLAKEEDELRGYLQCRSSHWGLPLNTQDFQVCYTVRLLL